MKRPNNRFRSGNNNNNGYTLNYKFDSVSIAGKVSGTALDLIRRYNDLAKEAQANGDYVDMEIYRQYAEHYRKIVTDINERRQTRYENSQARAEEESSSQETQEDNENSQVEEKTTEVAEPTSSNGYVETLPASETPKSFQVVEVHEEEKTTETVKPKRVYRRRTSVATKDKASEA